MPGGRDMVILVVHTDSSELTHITEEAARRTAAKVGWSFATRSPEAAAVANRDAMGAAEMAAENAGVGGVRTTALRFMDAAGGKVTEVA